MSRPILLMQNAGYGETLVPDDALFQPGEQITVGREDTPDTAVIVTCLAVVPAHGIVEYAIADQAKPPQPRPLMLRNRRAYKETVYVLQFEDDTEPRLYTQTEILKGREKADAQA